MSNPRTIHQIVDALIAATEPLGVSVSPDQLAAGYGVVGPYDIDTPVSARITSRPVLYDHTYESFTPSFEGHLGTVLFGLDLIEERKLPSLAYAFEAHGEDGALDLAYVMRFTLRVSELVTDARPAPETMPTKGSRVTVSLAVADDPDEHGQPVVRVSAFSLPKPKRARRATLGAALASVTTPEAKPAKRALAVSGDGHAGDDAGRLVAA